MIWQAFGMEACLQKRLEKGELLVTWMEHGFLVRYMRKVKVWWTVLGVFY